MKKFIYGMSCGAICLTLLQGHFHKKPEQVTSAQIIDALAIVIDGDGELHEKTVFTNRIKTPPIPQRKPEYGYTAEFRNNMTHLISTKL